MLRTDVFTVGHIIFHNLQFSFNEEERTVYADMARTSNRSTFKEMNFKRLKHFNLRDLNSHCWNVIYHHDCGP